VLDVVAAVRDLGFRRLSVYSPCRRLADEPFRRAFLERAPDELVVSVPLYGITAEVHDAVTGTPGSFAEAMSAFEALRAVASTRPVELRLSTVIVRPNVRALVDLVRFALAHGLPLDAHVPYPMRQTTRDPYAESAVRESEIVDRFVERAGELDERERSRGCAMLGGAVLHPCVLLRAERRASLPLLGARDGLDRRPMLTGTDYRSADKFVHAGGDQSGGADGSSEAFSVATVPCPHAAACALAPACPAEHYAVYQTLFGLDEYQPVTVGELYGTAPHPSVASRFAPARRS
jgi:hypothetical protein